VDFAERRIALVESGAARWKCRMADPRGLGESVGYDSKRMHSGAFPHFPTDRMTTGPAEQHDPAPDADASPSKTRRKHAMHALQDLGEALVALDPGRLRELDLPERLIDAVVQARGIRAHEGRRRQIQYIGKLMRTIDPAPVQAALESWAKGPREENARFAAVERWRDRLLVEPAALSEFVGAYPQADRRHLESLIHDANLERARGGPPHRYRELFRQLKAAVAIEK
jgi:ribosome-associated protein